MGSLMTSGLGDLEGSDNMRDWAGVSGICLVVLYFFSLSISPVSFTICWFQHTPMLFLFHSPLVESAS